MQAAAFQNNTTHEIVIAYEGTNLSDLRSPSNANSYLFPQLSADAAIANGTNPAANADALVFARNVADAAGGNPIYVTGHSLGGEEAEYVQANAVANGLAIRGGAAFGAPGVPQLSTQPSDDPNFTTYLDYGDGIGNFVPHGGAHVGNVQYVGNPNDATTEENLLTNDTTGAGSTGALAMMVGDHQLSNYASDLGQQLASTQNQSSLGSADVVDLINTYGIVPFGGAGNPASSGSPQDQNGSLVIGGETLSAAGSSLTLQFSDGNSAGILTGTGQTINAATANVNILVDAGGDNTIEVGSSSKATLISEATGTTLEGGSGQNLLIDLGNSGTVIGGSGGNQIWVGGTSDTVSSSGATINLGNGSNDSMTLASGTNDTVTNDVAGDSVSLDSNTSASFTGSGGAIDVDGTGITVTASNETVNEAAGGSFNLSGGSDTISMTGTGDYLGLLGGSGYVVNAAGDSIGTTAGTSLNVAGGNDSFSLGANNYLGLLGGLGLRGQRDRGQHRHDGRRQPQRRRWQRAKHRFVPRGRRNQEPREGTFNLIESSRTEPKNKRICRCL